MQELFETIRESCSRATWSKGVELARSGGVVGKHETDGQALFRVTPVGQTVARNVVLGLEELDWSCDCTSNEDVCAHVAGAVIALKRAREAGESLPVVKQVSATIGYRLRRTAEGLFFDRTLLDAGGEHPLEQSVASLASNEGPGTRVVATSADHLVERIVGTRRRGVFMRDTMVPVLEALAGSPDVTLDGKPVKVSTEGSLVVGRVVEQGAGFRLFVEQDPSITEVFANGAVLRGDVLSPIGALPVGPRELSSLREGRYFHQTQVAELVTDVLPSLRGRIPIDVRTNKLPRTVDEPPRIFLTLTQNGDAMEVLPTLVYGDPPLARVDANRLVHLQGAVPLRQLALEDRLVAELEKNFGLSVGRRDVFRGAEAIAMADRLRRSRASFGGAPLASFAPAAPLAPRLDVTGRRFDVAFESASEGGGPPRRADAKAVLKAWSEGASFVPLLDGGLAPLPADWLERFGARVAQLLAAKADGADELPPASMPELVALCDDLDYPAPPELSRLRPLVRDFAGLPEPKLPEDLRADLRGYQKQGFAWLSFLRDARLGALLADDMGLGKTLQTLCALRTGALVVAPTSVLHNWKAELARFRPSLKVATYHGAGRALDADADVTLTTYAILRLDVDTLAARKWDTVVLDEAQAIKNPDSQVARAAFALEADFRVCLSGTPVENRLEELWSEFHFLNRGLLGGRREFQESYARPVADGVVGAAARLRQKIRPFVLRRLKREVASELPPRTEVVLRCALNDDERRVYEAVKAASLAEVVERLQAGGNALAALEMLLRLRQAACHPALVPGQHATTSSKVELLVEQLAEAAEDGHKSLVFSQWTSLLDLVEPHLRAAKLDFTRLDGSTADRAGVVATFQANDGPPVMLLSLKAGGTGLNLTSADHVFLLDPWWNPAVEDQAADRAHRIGQERPVLVHRLVAEETVEERILALQEAKRALAGAALDHADQAAALTRDDLLGLLA